MDVEPDVEKRRELNRAIGLPEMSWEECDRKAGLPGIDLPGDDDEA